MALRTASPYRTVSDAAVQVVAGTISIHLLALERKNLFSRRREAPESAEIRNREREATLDRWGQVGYHLTQCLTAHGCFMTYLEKIGKTAEGKCMYCDEIDDAEQTIFLCHRWQRKQAEAEMVTRSLIVENLVEKMLESKENWTVIENFLVGVMKRKEEHERVEKLV